MNAIENFTSWAAEFHAPYSDTALSNATDAVIDTFACMLAGVKETGPGRLRATLPDLSGLSSGPASVMGLDSGSAPIWAALANGTAAHAHDLDDTFLPSINHPSSVLTSSLFALAQTRGLSGAAVLDAYIIGLELHYLVARGLMRSHADIGHHTTSTVGTIAGAAACARLLGLSAHQMAHAMSLGVSMAGGIKGQAGSMAKPLHAGLAAQHSVQGALMAEKGFEGRLEVLDGEWGYLQVCGGPDAQGWSAEMFAEIGKTALAIESKGLMVKRYPCCASTHRVLDSLLELRDEYGFREADVEHITATVPMGNYRNLTYHKPQTQHQAKFSMEYTMAVALLHGNVALADFDSAVINSAEVANVLPRMEMKARAAGAEKFNAEIVPPHTVTVQLRDGRVLERDRIHAKGTLFDPLSDADRWNKFLSCGAAVLNDAELKHAYDVLSELRSTPNMRGVQEAVFDPVAQHLH
ncbi:MmgE/PrpD family protein [Caballeronia sp. LP003]|uniref:MmgE/PrpD family protein n=1 Tax=Caballeronia sp. LP003 TaxID=3038551 RepID=UPI0028627936|nr:MmgE/PrpD family protein [Caballeronia sp. LP003]MDR5785488.1 MmgE/PrpD family protein [Caballeronia sp. LP003]